MWKAGSVLVIASMLFASCTKDKASNGQCPPCIDTVSFKTVIIPIFAASCAVTGCHNATTDAFSINLDSAHAYASATEPGTGNITPGDAEGSLLYTIINSGGSNGMPPDGYTPLTACEIDEIGCWINQGAKNN